jgi:CRP/FNR family transcriptional regulator, cyclic AMP receptor protein
VTELWDLLADEEAAELERVSRHRAYPRGGVLFREADESDSVLVLLTGRVKVTCLTSGGTEVVLAVRGPGALLGEISAIDREPRSATVQALEPVTVLLVPLAEFEGYLQLHGRVAYLLMRLLASRLRDADRKRIEFGAHDTTGRVAARLVEMAERFGRPVADGVRIALPLSQDELAGWTGASREAVSKALGALRADGLIRTGRLSVVVHDLDALRERAR